jgi:hypothetical protein
LLAFNACNYLILQYFRYFFILREGKDKEKFSSDNL